MTGVREVRGQLQMTACRVGLLAAMTAPACYLSHGLDEDRQPAPAEGGALAQNVPAPVADVEVPPCERELRMVDASSLPVDMLFVVDNSGSMAQEQGALADQFPRLVEILTSGDLDGDGAVDFPRVEDLHLGVVSTDMGLVGVDGIPNCIGLGDDAVLRNTSAPLGGCGGPYPPFLAYEVGDDAEAVARDFGCVASLGTVGCGFEQPLEAGLKALWPFADQRVTFLPDRRGQGSRGHGGEANAGFERADSVLVVVMVTDEEDCSSYDTVHLTPAQYLPDGSALRQQPINLRCFYNSDNLFSVDRYINGLRTLRQENPQLVLFAAIAGVPQDLVDERARADVDLGDEAQRQAYYDGILADERMLEQVDESEPEIAKRQLIPSCETATGRAFPPRRFVQVARGFGQNGIVQSICQDDFGPAMHALAERLGETLTLAQCVD